MYNINMELYNNEKSFSKVVLAISTTLFILLLLTLITNIKSNLNYNAKKLSNKVEINSNYDRNGNEFYSPTYYFEVKGKTYKCESTAATGIYPTENNKFVYYNTKNPNKCTNEFDNYGNYWLAAFLLFPLLLIIYGLKIYIKNSKKIKNINTLNKVGKLVKNIPYTIILTGATIDDCPTKAISINYKLPAGEIVTLYSEARYNFPESVNYNTVDMVIDEQNPKNHYIDFKIDYLEKSQLENKKND